MATIPGSLGTVTLTWDQMPGALYYKIYRSPNSGGPYTIIGYSNPVPYSGSSTPAVNSYTDGPNDLGLQAAYYVVTTMTVDGESPYSAEIVANANSQAPSPTSGAATVT